MISLAKKYDGQEWKNIQRYIRKHMAYVNQYLLSDGSLVSRTFTKIGEERVSIVEFKDDGIKIRAQNKHESKRDSKFN